MLKKSRTKGETPGKKGKIDGLGRDKRKGRKKEAGEGGNQIIRINSPRTKNIR